MIDPYRLLDRAIFTWILRKSATPHVEGIISGARKWSDDKVYEIIDEATGDIDAKASALLSHISIMIVVITFIYAKASGVFRAVICLEFVVYLVLAIMCLRGIRLTWKFSKLVTGEEIDITFYAIELFKRGEIYGLASRATILATFSMVLVVVSDLIFIEFN